MRFWRFWWNTLRLSSQYNPPWFVEQLMVLLVIVMVGIWVITQNWPYLVLSLSYAVGFAVSVLVREAIAPSPYPRLTQVIAVLLLVVSFYAFADLAHLMR